MTIVHLLLTLSIVLTFGLVGAVFFLGFSNRDERRRVDALEEKLLRWQEAYVTDLNQINFLPPQPDDLGLDILDEIERYANGERS